MYWTLNNFLPLSLMFKPTSSHSRKKCPYLLLCKYVRALTTDEVSQPLELDIGRSTSNWQLGALESAAIAQLEDPAFQTNMHFEICGPGGQNSLTKWQLWKFYQNIYVSMR